jgi:hypothetical protein
MSTNKFKTQRFAKKDDVIIIIKDKSNSLTKGKEYRVLGISGGWAGQAVLVQDDNGQPSTVNGFWWDFPSDLSEPIINEKPN